MLQERAFVAVSRALGTRSRTSPHVNVCAPSASTSDPSFAL